MKKLLDRIIYELTRSPEIKKPDGKTVLRRLLAGFFIMMLILTMISRSLDSFTIAKVQTAKAKRGILDFVIKGTGTLEAASEQFIDLYEGALVGAVEAKVGQYVEKGTVLLRYDMEDLKEIREELGSELKKEELSLEKEKLNQEEAAADTAPEVARIKLQRAELDLSIAEEGFQLAKTKLKKEIKEQYEDAKAAYEYARETYSARRQEGDAAARKAEYYLAEAKEALGKLTDIREEAEEALAAYKAAVLLSSAMLTTPEAADTSSAGIIEGSDISQMIRSIDNSYHKIVQEIPLGGTGQSAAAYNAAEEALASEVKNIIKVYYGEQEYETHLEEVAKAKEALTRAREDAKVTFINAMETGSILSTERKVSCVRAYENTYDELEKSIKKDKELSEAIRSYGAALRNNNDADINNTYQAVLGKVTKAEDPDWLKALKEAEETAVSAKEELEKTKNTQKLTLKEASEAVSEAKEKLSEATDTYFAVLDGSIDYTKVLNAEAGALMTAQRNLEDARISLTEAKEKDEDSLQTSNKNRQLYELNVELARMKVEERKEAVEAMDLLLSRQGEVTAPADGVVQKLEPEAGNRITGSQRVSLSLEQCRFVTKVTKEEAKHLEQGDDMTLTVKRREIIHAVIEGIGPEDSEGRFPVTATLPEGEFTAGTTAEFVVEHQSEQYYKTVPIQSVRSDAIGVNYVLVLRESKTVLGNEQTVSRLNVTVLDKNYDTAAIEADLGEEDRIVVTSSKNIEEGDRVRTDGDIE